MKISHTKQWILILPSKLNRVKNVKHREKTFQQIFWIHRINSQKLIRISCSILQKKQKNKKHTEKLFATKSWFKSKLIPSCAIKQSKTLIKKHYYDENHSRISKRFFCTRFVMPLDIKMPKLELDTKIVYTSLSR